MGEQRKHKWVKDTCELCGTPRDKIGPHSYVYGWPDGSMSGWPPDCRDDLRAQKIARLRAEFILALPTRKESDDGE